jgi:hypothetical protein
VRGEAPEALLASLIGRFGLAPDFGEGVTAVVVRTPDGSDRGVDRARSTAKSPSRLQAHQAGTLRARVTAQRDGDSAEECSPGEVQLAWPECLTPNGIAPSGENHTLGAHRLSRRKSTQAGHRDAQHSFREADDGQPRSNLRRANSFTSWSSPLVADCTNCRTSPARSLRTPT